ncbi:30S ribosomal protein S7 [Candidatus Microgenomates bacterium]|nr:30S ribosomal protein S7 [Candidatus Microgenomates bacterium]
MVRRKTKSLQRVIPADRLYQSVTVQRLINKVTADGKKSLAERLVYNAMEKAAKDLKKDPMEVLDAALKNVSPVLEVKSRRIGGATYQIPFEVKGNRQVHLALMWLIGSARSKKGRPFQVKLAEELVNAHNNTGEAVKKREDAHKMAEANRAFAHLARF